MLEWLKIHRYRDVAPGTELAFHEGHHVILGPNGGGKTTALNVISAVLRGSFESLKSEEFHFEYRLRSKYDTMDASISRLKAHAGVEGPNSIRWEDRFDATVRLNGKEPVTVSVKNGNVSAPHPNEAIELPGTVVYHQLWRALLGERGGDWTRNPFANFCAHRFDELLGFHSYVQGRRDLGFGPLRISISTPKRRSVISSSEYSWMFAWLIDTFQQAFVETNSVDRIQVPLEKLGILQEAVVLLGMSGGAFRSDLGKNEKQDGLNTFEYDRFQFRFERQDGTIVIDEHLSFGQKRLLSFLFYLAANDGPVIADELVDGMHYRWVERCLELMKGRQTFLSSQSPLLMDFLGFDSAEEVQRTFIRCERVFEDGRDQMVWRNLTADEAAEFFEAWQVGIQHVSELLRDRGLW